MEAPAPHQNGYFLYTGRLVQYVGGGGSRKEAPMDQHRICGEPKTDGLVERERIRESESEGERQRDSEIIRTYVARGDLVDDQERKKKTLK